MGAPSHVPGGAGAGSLQNGNDKRPRVSRGASVDPWAMLQKNGELNKDMILIVIFYGDLMGFNGDLMGCDGI